MTIDNLIPGGHFVSYANDVDQEGFEQVQYGSDETAFLIPRVQAVYERVAGVWTMQRIRGATTISTSEPAANQVQFELLLRENFLGVNTDDRLTVELSANAPGQIVAWNTAIETFATAQAGDSIRVDFTGYDTLGGAVYAPTDGDQIRFTIANP